MTPDLHYPNAPITEAVIDIQVATSADLQALKRVQMGEEGNYPTSQDLSTQTMVFGPDVMPPTASSQLIGFLYRSSDQKQIFQTRTNGFAFSRLAPYPHWAAFSAEARRLWDKYRAVAEPSAITRVAVRYVNRIDIPLPVESFEDYLRTVPQLSQDLPQGLSGYFMHLAIPLADVKCEGIINQTIIEPASANVVSLVLDIDVFRATELPTSEQQLWDLLEQLRHTKNRVFEACITDRARGLFK